MLLSLPVDSSVGKVLRQHWMFIIRVDCRLQAGLMCLIIHVTCLSTFVGIWTRVCYAAYAKPACPIRKLSMTFTDNGNLQHTFSYLTKWYITIHTAWLYHAFRTQVDEPEEHFVLLVYRPRFPVLKINWIHTVFLFDIIEYQSRPVYQSTYWCPWSIHNHNYKS